MYYLRFTNHLEADIRRGWSAYGRQVSGEGALDFAGDAYELADKINAEGVFSSFEGDIYPMEEIGDDEALIVSDLAEVVSSDFIEITNGYGTTVELRALDLDGKKIWCEVDQRHDGLACYASEELSDLQDILNQFEKDGLIIPDAADEFASGMWGVNFSELETIEAGQAGDHKYYIWKA